MVDLLERIDVMLEQELSAYKTVDYLSPEFQKKLIFVPEDDASPESSAPADLSTASSSSSCNINEVWREKICEWSYQVIDHFDFSREIASVSIHYLDRYLGTRQVNKKVFQLAAMTSLFLAIKLYEPGRLSMSSMIELSRGYFMVEQMAAMETSILRALSWRVHPPTSYCFVKHVLFLLPYSSISMDTRHDVLELSRFLTELSVIDYYFVVHRPSSVALAALLNAMEGVPGVSQDAINGLLGEMKRITKLDVSAPDVLECRERLRLLYSQGGYSPPEPRSETRTEMISPVCVSYGCNGYPQASFQDGQVSEQEPKLTDAISAGARVDSTGNANQVVRNLATVANTAQPPSNSRF